VKSVPFSSWFTLKKPDIETLKARKDTAGLIRALRSRDTEVQVGAAKALGTLGPDALDKLETALGTRNKTVKLGIIGALSEIGSPRSIAPLKRALTDENSEVRWQAAIALGEINDQEAIGPLQHALRDPDKYVRYGAAFSLAKLGWKPLDPAERAYYFAGMQEWNATKEIGKPAIPALTGLLRDRDSKVRIKAVELMGAIHDPSAIPALMKSLGDENREVRWNTVLASPKCGVSLTYLPRGLSKRPQTTKNPLVAGFLNFLLPGLGYGYLGKWWGTMIFQIDVMATVWIFRMEGDTNSYTLLFPIYLLLAIHAWYITTKMPKDPP
jgi:hypothetical protein